MTYRRKTAKRRSRRILLAVLLLIALFYAIWGRDVWQLSSSKVEVSGIAQLAPGKNLRRAIYDRNMGVLALSLQTYSVYARPLELKKEQNTIAVLVQLLGLNNKQLHRQLRTERSLVWLKRHIDHKSAQKIAVLQLKGIYLVPEWQRLYPNGRAASQVVGFVKDEQGLAGMEFVYDSLLRGEWPLEDVSLQIAGIDRHAVPKNGASVVLCLDISLQRLVEKRLAGLLKKTGAQSGMAVMLNALNGEVLVMANVPSYDPNLYWDFKSFNRRNRVVSESIYLGGLAGYFKLAADIRAGHGLVPEFRSTGGGKIMLPRKTKMGINSHSLLSKSVWQMVQEGVYRSPYLDDSEGAESNSQEEQFYHDIGLPRLVNNSLLLDQDHSELDQDLGREPFKLSPLAQATLLNIATAFGRMVNSGRAIRPHVLHGLWIGPDKGELQANFSPHGQDGLFESDEFIDFVRSQYGGKGRCLVFESLFAMPDKGADGIEFAGGEKESVAKRFEALGVGVCFVGSTPLVLAMSLDGLTAFGEKLVYEQVMKQIFRQAGTRKVKSTKHNGALGDKLESFFNKWQEIHGQKKLVDTVRVNDNTPEYMPELRGMSLRKAMQGLSGRGLRLQISGAGRVVGQVPRAGMTIDNGQGGQLKLFYPVLGKSASGNSNQGKQFDGPAAH